jgi:MinD-like ATPase involved in chromosome partitioning or flagellar assembly
MAKNQLFEQYGIEYLFLDTSPGIRYWSINALAAAGTLFLILKDSDMDIDGTKRMINDIYDSLAKFGSKFFVILNKVPGASPITENRWGTDGSNVIAGLEKEIESRIVGSIPCFCDVQFSRHEFLWAIKQPEHPFSKKLTAVAEAIRSL